MFICLEGPSAVGKSTVCNALADHFFVIPEVNLLYQNEDRNEENWYLRKQLARFQLAVECTGNAVLDGDVFQPIWYSWIYGLKDDAVERDRMFQFFENAMDVYGLVFPAHYFYLYADLVTLQHRKKNDPNRHRRNFEKHLAMLRPQRTYFEFLANETDVPVTFIKASDSTMIVHEILAISPSVELPRFDHKGTLASIGTWLRDHQAVDY